MKVYKDAFKTNKLMQTCVVYEPNIQLLTFYEADTEQIITRQKPKQTDNAQREVIYCQLHNVTTLENITWVNLPSSSSEGSTFGDRKAMNRLRW